MRVFFNKAIKQKNNKAKIELIVLLFYCFIGFGRMLSCCA